jgi:hypothetical protein
MMMMMMTMTTTTTTMMMMMMIVMVFYVKRNFSLQILLDYQKRLLFEIHRTISRLYL